MEEFEYSGMELELFISATNWKRYVSSLISQYIMGDVLEVGAGIGGNTCLLCRSHHRKWLCLEPDPKLFQTLKSSARSCSVDNCFFQNSTVSSLSHDQLFDSILYLDVLEHIKEDEEEVIKASQHLRTEGYLIILAPAYQWLYTPFDSAIGHYRRYNKSRLKHILPASIEVTKLIYLDCVGLLAILGNKFILKQSQASAKQILFWNGLMIPLSKGLDVILRYKFGKSILLIGKKI